MAKRKNEIRFSEILKKLLVKFILPFFAVFIIYSVLAVLLFKWINPPTTAFIQNSIRNAQLLKMNFAVSSIKWVPLNKISKNVVLAVIASEDQRFLQHHGFDVTEIEKAIQDKMKGKRLRGASTISQQVAKNLFLWSDKSYIRKIVESYYTFLLELIWDKHRIIEVYLNIAEFGDNVYGIGKASKLFYHKSASNLGKYESALLASVLPNPKKFKVKYPSQYLRLRQRDIVEQMHQLGGITFIKELY